MLATGDIHVRYAALVIIAAAAAMPSGYSQAQSQEDKALALLRASSAQSAIITFCGKHFTIDGTTALRISQTTRDVATKVLGEERSSAAFKEELARRYAEVKEAGERQWCADQRVALAGSDVQIFKD
jgi:type II secretory pathway pseudopilin PulG